MIRNVNQDAFFISNSELRNEWDRTYQNIGKVHHYSNTKILLLSSSKNNDCRRRWRITAHMTAEEYRGDVLLWCFEVRHSSSDFGEYVTYYCGEV